MQSKHGAIPLLPTIELYVDLPSSRRGVHLSRDPESLYEVLNEYTDSEVYLLEDFCEALVRGLLSKHEYASRAEVNLQS